MAKDRIEDLLKTWEPRIRDAFLQSVRAMGSRVDVAAVTAMLKAGNIEGAFRAVSPDPTSLRPLAAAIEQAFEAGGVDATDGIKPTRGPLGLRISPIFDVRAPSAEIYIRQRTTDLVRQITEDQRDLIRQTLQPLQSGIDAMMTGETPQKLALDLVGRINKVTGRREGGVLGLTSHQAQWARNYESELSAAIPDADALTRKLRDKRYDRTVAKAIRDGTSIPAATRRAMVDQYRNRALRARADGIASAEALSVLHHSQLEAWDQAIGRGAVTENKVRRFWITAGDDRVRPEHAAIPGMNASGVRLRETFQTPDGPQMYPPIDPGCRCRVRVRVIA